MQVFTGHAEMTPLALMLKDSVPIKSQKLMEVEKLSKTMTESHAHVTREMLHVMEKLQFKKNEMTHVRSPNACRGTPQERYVQAAGEVEGPAPHRECGVRLCVCSGESAHEEAEGRARNTFAILSG
jgi:hypothetical protein